MVKNTGIPENQLSDFDMGSVLKDSHNKELHALDVNVVNSLVPESYDKVTYELKDFGDGTKDVEFLNFYNNGVKNSTQIDLRSTFLGTAEITTFSFTLETPASLDGKYIIIYDDVGSVGVWFDLDGGSTPPTTGAARDIEVDIATGDSTDTLASKFASTLNSDSKFSGATVVSLAVIQSSTVGNKTDATGGTTSMTPSITDGVSTLNNTYFLLYSANDLTAYYVWFNYNSTGTDPNLANKTGIEITFSDSDSHSDLSTRVATTVNALDDFTASFDGCIAITNSGVGVTTATTDNNTDSTFTTLATGTAGSLVAKIQVFFDSDYVINSIERVV